MHNSNTNIRACNNGNWQGAISVTKKNILTSLLIYTGKVRLLSNITSYDHYILIQIFFS